MISSDGPSPWHPLTRGVRRQQTLFDRYIGEWIDQYATSGGTIHCGRGCQACCTLAVNCTFTEALGVAETLTDLQTSRLRDHVARLRTVLPAAADLKSWLGLHRTVIGSCPFLEADGACGVYTVRPFSCRALLSTKESRWCGADFSVLGSEEKRTFVASLDLTVVAFPMHYVRVTQELGQELEALAAQRMREQFGFSLYGNFPVLAHLEREHRLSTVFPAGREAVEQLLTREGLNHPFLATLDS